MEELRSQTDGMIRESRNKPQHKATGGTRQKEGCDEEEACVWELGSWDHREGVATVRMHTATLSRERRNTLDSPLHLSPALLPGSLMITLGQKPRNREGVYAHHAVKESLTIGFGNFRNYIICL